MSISTLRRLLPAAGCMAAALAAPPASAGLRPDPLDPSAEVPRTVYRSPLGGYRAMAEQPVGSWRETNDTVGRVGGWRAYAREAAAAEPVQSGRAASAPPPTPPTPAAQAAGAPPSAPGGHADPGHAGHRRP